MSKPFTVLAGLVLLAIAALHGYRLYTGTLSVIVAGHLIPIWVSWPAGAVALLLGVMLLFESRR